MLLNMRPITTEYLNEKQLRGFDKYKYNAVDTSPISIYIMHPFWNMIVKIFPEWIAPNLLTFLGFLILIVSFLIMSFVDWSFYASSRQHPQHPTIPSTVFVVLGIGQFLAHTLDGIDGKQARRTNSSNPLGELFDHGSDSVIACLLPLGIYSVFGRSYEDYGADVWLLYWVMWLIVATFYLSHWEKYLTGIMFLPWAYDLSQLILAVVYIVTGLFGYEIWKGTYANGFEFRYFFIATSFGGSLVLSVPNTLWNVYKSYRDGTGKKRSFLAAIEPAYSPVFLFIMTTLWAYLSPSDIVRMEPRMFCLMIGLVVSNMSCHLIISQMTDTRAECFNWLLVPVTGVASVCIGFDLGSVELYLLYWLIAVVMVSHVHFGVSVVNQLADHFNIYVFSLAKYVKASHSSEANW